MDTHIDQTSILGPRCIVRCDPKADPYPAPWHVRFGSKADILRGLSDVRFTPRKRTFGTTARANSGHSAMQNKATRFRAKQDIHSVNGTVQIRAPRPWRPAGLSRSDFRHKARQCQVLPRASWRLSPKTVTPPALRHLKYPAPTRQSARRRLQASEPQCRPALS